MTAPAEQEPPAPTRTESTIFSTPTDVKACQAEYAAGADVRRKFDATARRQYRAA